MKSYEPALKVLVLITYAPKALFIAVAEVNSGARGLKFGLSLILQCSPFTMLRLGSIGMDPVISEVIFL